MDDQFGGRTDDDLFADDFEPPADLVEVKPAALSAEASAPALAPALASETPMPDTNGSTTVTDQRPAQPAPPKAAPTGPKSLAQSRHPPKPRHARKHQGGDVGAAPASDDANSSAPQSGNVTPAAAAPSPASASVATSGSGPTVEAAAAAPSAATPTAPTKDARLQSGANPRTKLTEDELSAKMAAMRIRNAEMARKFEQAERDKEGHRVAYERGMEEARRRRLADEERRRRDAEDRRRMDDEREKNRARKLQAMGMKEGGWDEGKEEQLQRDEPRRGFRGANGGVRGARSGAGFGADGDVGGADSFGEREGRGRGRGRGGSGRGRGGFRNGEEGQQGRFSTPSSAKPTAAPDLAATDQFPSLPASDVKASGTESKPRITSVDTPGAKKSGQANTTPLPIPSLLTPVGKWDEEVTAAAEAKNDRAAAL